jgi:hypothetical protein
MYQVADTCDFNSKKNLLHQVHIDKFSRAVLSLVMAGVLTDLDVMH